MTFCFPETQIPQILNLFLKNLVRFRFDPTSGPQVLGMCLNSIDSRKFQSGFLKISKTEQCHFIRNGGSLRSRVQVLRIVAVRFVPVRTRFLGVQNCVWSPQTTIAVLSDTHEQHNYITSRLEESQISFHFYPTP